MPCTFLSSSDFLILRSRYLLISIAMKKGKTYITISDVGKGKAAMEGKRKRASHRTRIRMDFNPKTSKLHDQEATDKYLASYGFRLNSRIKIEFCPYSVDVSLVPPKIDSRIWP